MPKVSVVITAHNYGKYLKQCLESTLNQNYDDYEVIVVNDGSTDNTTEVLQEYENRVKIINLPGLGLAAACNRGIAATSGEYIIRLDADDFFDENILLIEADYLDDHQNVDLVYPDYYLVNEKGEIIEHVKQMKVGEELKLLYRNPLAAGAMFRKKKFKELGGYIEKPGYTEDYDFWIRFATKYKVANINLPLMYYRKHGKSMSSDHRWKTGAIRHVKEEFVKTKLSDMLKKIKILAIIPARAESRIDGGKLALRSLNGKPLIAYTIEEALKCRLLNRVVVSTEDEEIAEVAKGYGAEVPFFRPKELSAEGVSVELVALHILDRFKEKEKYVPDIIAILHVVSPLKKEYHITEAINTMLIFNVDTVISATNNNSFHWRPGPHGLSPLFEKRLLKHEREILYEENGAIYVVKREVLEKTMNVIGKSVAHIEMLPSESIHVDSEFDFWMAEQILKRELKLRSQEG
ncbi:MAG TPA: glycosyltransferase [Hadesarchaea archaeon]|nr:glycosyltransferase [Hadesarchaea archaeon]